VLDFGSLVCDKLCMGGGKFLSQEDQVLGVFLDSQILVGELLFRDFSSRSELTLASSNALAYLSSCSRL